MNNNKRPDLTSVSGWCDVFRGCLDFSHMEKKPINRRQDELYMRPSSVAFC